MKVSDLFSIAYGHSLSLNALKQAQPGKGVAFVSRTAKNNGVSAWVERIEGVEPLPAGLLTVALRSRNHSLSTFVQPREFYCGYHIYVLTPKNEMTLQEKLWWAECIKHNRYRYNFGRQANRTLADLELPDEVPDWVFKASLPSFGPYSPMDDDRVLDTDTWRPFRLDEVFELHRGRNILKRNMKPGETAYVSASAVNNAISAWIDQPADYEGGQITVNSNGSVGEAFYQPKPFIASGDVTVLVPKGPMSEAAALFICTLIRAEKYRWNYGRKWVTGRMKESVIRLPATPAGDPDWEGMDRAIRRLPQYAVVRSEAFVSSV